MGWDPKATDPLEWAAKTKNAPREAVNIFAFSLFNRVVMRTPVDTGAARQNWLVTLNSGTEEADPSKTTGSVLTDGGSVIDRARGDDKIIIQNNLPYIKKLEYGGFTKKPQTEKTVGGFSKQAPQGMVGLVLAKADDLWKRAVEAAKGH